MSREFGIKPPKWWLNGASEPEKQPKNNKNPLFITLLAAQPIIKSYRYSPGRPLEKYLDVTKLN
jgi:hypothetical protein